MNDEEIREQDVRFRQQLDQVRPVTRNLIESVLLDAWPRTAAVVDFGLDTQEHYEALYYPIREREIMPADLDGALGHGARLTELVRGARSNPHPDIEFHTSWDIAFGRESYLKSVGVRAAAGDRGVAEDKDREM